VRHYFGRGSASVALTVKEGAVGGNDGPKSGEGGGGLVTCVDKRSRVV
jgi:hypothetical protein